MNTIDAYEKDIDLQLDFLKSFKKQKSLSSAQQKKYTLFWKWGFFSIFNACRVLFIWNDKGNGSIRPVS